MSRGEIVNGLIHSIIPSIVAIVAATIYIVNMGRDIDTLADRISKLETTLVSKGGPPPVSTTRRRVEFNYSGPWGRWTDPQFCDSGEYVCGIAQKVEGNQRKGDDTAMNAVAFYCCSETEGPDGREGGVEE